MKRKFFVDDGSIAKTLALFQLDYYRAIHSFKTAIACILGLALFRYFDLPSGQWIPITIIVVMSAQSHFGAALQKAYMRFLGTLGGVLTALFTFYFFGNNIYAMFIVIFFACILFTYIASAGGNISYAGTLGGVTTVLALASPGSDSHLAIIRGFCIVIGIIIALFVSRLIFPIHARDQLRYSIAENLRNFRKLIFNIAQSNFDILPKEDQSIKLDLTEKIAEQPQLIEEASIGSHHFSRYKKKLYIDVMNCERRLNRLINFLYRSSGNIKYSEYILHKTFDLEQMQSAIEFSLDDLAESFEKNILPQHIKEIETAAKKLNQIIKGLPKNEASVKEDAQKLLEEHSYLYFLEQIINEIELMQSLVIKINVK